MKSTLTILLLLTALAPLKSFGNEFVCNLDDPFHQAVKAQSQQLQKAPSDIKSLITMSKYLETLGLAEKALKLADKALELEPDSGEAMVAKIHALHLLGKHRKALKLSEQAFENKDKKYQFPGRLKSWLRHSLLAMYLDNRQFDKVETLVLTQFPKTLQLADKAVSKNSLRLGVPIHTLAALIYAYRNNGKPALAEQLARHLQGFSAEGFFDKPFSELVAVQQWMLASIWVVDPKRSDAAVDALKAAYDGGFRLNWRFNYQHHPVYWSLKQNPEFITMIQGIENQMKSAQSCLSA